MKPVRLALLASHPIPYQAPLFKRLAQEERLETMVFFGDDYGLKPRRSEWGIENFTWAGGIVDGYPHRFLPNLARTPHPSRFAGKLNPTLRRELRRFRPDASLLFGYGSIYHLQALLWSSLLGYRTLYVSDASRIPDTSARGRAKQLLLSQVIYPRIDAFLTIGARSREHYLACGVPSAKFFAFPYSVDNDHFRNRAAAARPGRPGTRARFGVSDSAACVVYVGRLAPEKNIAELIHGVAGTKNHFLLLIGTGPEQEALSALANELLPGRHHFAGFMNYDRIAEGYAAADIFALTSTFEPWGLVCNEAMASGLPVVLSSRVGAAPDLVVEGKTGFTYPSGDAAALTCALEAASEMLRRDADGVELALLEKLSGYSIDRMVEGLLRALGVGLPSEV